MHFSCEEISAFAACLTGGFMPVIEHLDIQSVELGEGPDDAARNVQVLAGAVRGNATLKTLRVNLTDAIGHESTTSLINAVGTTPCEQFHIMGNGGLSLDAVRALRAARRLREVVLGGRAHLELEALGEAVELVMDRYGTKARLAIFHNGVLGRAPADQVAQLHDALCDPTCDVDISCELPGFDRAFRRLNSAVNDARKARAGGEGIASSR